MTTNGDRWTQVEREYTCPHPQMDYRRRVKSNGTIGYVKQCPRCGFTTAEIKKDSVPLKVLDPSFLSHDPTLVPRWYEAKRQRYQSLVQQDRQNWRDWYGDYLNSPAWQSRRSRVLERAHNQCEGCGVNRASEVHHLTYLRAGQELLFDLVAVCRSCHEVASRSQGHGESP